jgi:hypothetical protein
MEEETNPLPLIERNHLPKPGLKRIIALIIDYGRSQFSARFQPQIQTVFIQTLETAMT